MKIAVLVYEYPPKIVGGLGTYAAEITRKFVLHGHDVTVFTMNDDQGSLPTRELLRGIEIHRPVHIDVSDSLPDVVAEDVKKWLEGSFFGLRDLHEVCLKKRFAIRGRQFKTKDGCDSGRDVNQASTVNRFSVYIGPGEYYRYERIRH